MRYNYNIESNDYGDFFANGFYRRGLSNASTLGANIAYSQDIQNFGLMWTQAVRNILVFDSVVLASHDDRNKINYSVGLSASKDFGQFSMGLSSRRMYPNKTLSFWVMIYRLARHMPEI